ncbi:nucleoside phosphorylase domain-containing protein [Aspergillus keveii]|uniref:Nucleoside phosphorylase domain-containing protein n=1 Tax=Aspergillus keveii TaxID=714993 RepID=A0ABR4GD92_9EURO
MTIEALLHQSRSRHTLYCLRLSNLRAAFILVTSMASPPTSRNDFEIAIVCALPAEYNAVTELVDHFWEDHGYEYGKAREDANTYTTARIGNYDVVLVLLSGTGKAIAASSATSLRSSYPRIKLLLLTGICGGVPLVGTEDGILLGDVVLSETVIQYDYGRRYPDKFIMKHTVEESLSRPAKEVRNLVAIFKTNRALQKLQQRAAFSLEQIQDKALGQRSKINYKYPGATNDRLFAANLRHKHHLLSDCLYRNCHTESDPVCEESRTLLCYELGCNKGDHIKRHRLKAKERLQRQGRNKEAQAPSTFVGRIGSGDIVLKSGEDRDRLAKLYSILAFEMEGAGAWDELPCIVIKGVSDYADSHKNDKWQDFAAATAASTMKALLERYTPPDKPANSSLSIHSLQIGPGMAYAERNEGRSRVPVSGISPHNLPYLNTRLRRKSPRGTITGDYDASATPTAPAPPPTKYIRGHLYEEKSQGSESLNNSMPYTPVLTATGRTESIGLEAQGDISDQGTH